ncbi:unnamed protein product, partial [Choristocarpus tenellus]
TVSLEILLALLTRYGGQRFQSPDGPFVGWVKRELCSQLLGHCTSNVTTLVSLSLRIFVALVAKFK